MTFTRRVLVTFVTPVLLVLLSGRLLLPGVSDLVGEANAAPDRLSVFALGIFPFIAAYQLVEIVAFLWPSLSRRRHGDPALRAKLDLAVHFVTLAIAGMQAFGFAAQLKALAYDSPVDLGHVSTPVIMVTLVGGVCVQVVLARTITRAGLANGVAVLLAANVVQHVCLDVGLRLRATPTSPKLGGALSDLFKSHDAATPLESAVVLLAIVLVVIASVVALARAAGMRLDSGPAEGGPYRGARALVLHPSFPVPSSSYGALTIARSLLLLPAVLANAKIPGMSALAYGGATTYLVLVLVVMVLLAFWIHRPAELADVSKRLGIETDPGQARRALVQTLLPTFPFFVIVILCGQAAGMDLSETPLAVAVVLDVIVSMRLARGATTWVPVWEERRATAVPVIRAVLAARGIETEVSGMSLLWLMQLFAPFAPAVIAVKEEDAEQAQRLLADLAFSAADSASAASPVVVKAPELAPGRRAVYLVGLLALTASLALVGARVRGGGADADAGLDLGPPSQLELVRIDDTRDPLDSLKETDIPENSGISLYRESAPAGPGQVVQVSFARIMARPGEPKAETRARLQAFLDKVKIEPGNEPARFALEELQELDEDTRKVTYLGYRSFLLSGPAELTNADVDDAMVVFDKEMHEPSVNVILTKQGAQRFEDVTGRWVQRRFAIVLDGVVESAPVIKARISGGRLTISMGRTEPEQALANARRLEKTLRGHRDR